MQNTSLPWQLATTDEETISSYSASQLSTTPVPALAEILTRAQQFAQPILQNRLLDSGEDMFFHAHQTSHILHTIGSSNTVQAGIYLSYASAHLNKPQEVLSKAFNMDLANLAMQSHKLSELMRQTASKSLNLPLQVKNAPDTSSSGMTSAQLEIVRKMLLAFSRDLRVVLLRLASRLQTLRFYAQTKKPIPLTIAYETINILAPLANRLGIWQLKWELEDLAFRFLQPKEYQAIAQKLDEKRALREAHMQQIQHDLEQTLQQLHISASVQARPKHLYSIYKKMQGKSLPFERILDIRAVRIIVPTIENCYAALSMVHTRYQALDDEFKDYIAQPKANGYQSLHTVVLDTQHRAIEIQIRTQAMHDIAESGAAAHWVYKEAGTKGYAGVSATSAYDAKIAMLRQLLAWEHDLSAQQHASTLHSPKLQDHLLADRIYVLTPQATIIDLPQGATAIDFAYALHTDLGHRCRGARIDNVLLPLNTPLKNGQTVEIISSKEGGPSRDWLNADLGYLVSSRAKTKVRAWFNAQILTQTITRGRESIEKLLQREGKTSTNLTELAQLLGFKQAESLFEVVGKDELSLKTIETVLKNSQTSVPTPNTNHLPQNYANQPLANLDFSPSQLGDWVKTPAARATHNVPTGQVLVVGVDSLLTQLAKCCKPVPPDAIGGFVTRGKGVSIHRQNCINFHALQQRNPNRVIEVTWDAKTLKNINTTHEKNKTSIFYNVDLGVEVQQLPQSLKGVLEVIAKAKINTVDIKTHTNSQSSKIVLTLQINSSLQIQTLIKSLQATHGVLRAWRL